MFPRLRKGGVALALSLVAAQAVAEPQSVPASLPGVLQWTLQHHPELRQLEFERQAQSSRADVAELGPPLSLQTEVENFAGRGEFAGADRLETTVSLAGVLERGDKPMLRRVEALSEAEVQLVAMDQQRRDRLAEAATRFLELARAQANERLLADAVVVAEQTADASDERQRAGAASAADAKRAALALAASRLRARQAQTRRQGAAQALAIAVGTPNKPVSTVRMDWRRLPPPPDRAQLLMSAQHTPLLRLASADRDLALARLRLAASQARGDLEWSVGIRDDRGSGDQALVLGIGLPLGSAGRAGPAQAVAKAHAEASHWAQQSARLKVQALVTTAWAELDALNQAFEQIRDALEPQAEAVLHATADGYRQGRYSLLELTTAQQERLDWQQRRIAVATEYHQTRIELERLLGRSLDQEIEQ